jgi:CRISPR/Cas system-associated exonuclease Cas4 (RecB family)
LKKKIVPNLIKEIKSKTFPEIEYSYQKSISYSQMSMFRTCPRKWALQYKEGHYTSEQSIHMTFGTALHETIQHYLTVFYEVSGAEADRIDLESHFQNKLSETYKKNYKDNKKIHFSDPAELGEFYEDGLEIIKFIKSKKNLYFGKKGYYLVGCEIPIQLTPHQHYKNIIYKGYLDLVIYHEPTKTLKIIDIKTSTRGWDDKTKKDEDKQFQLILYKQFFSQIHNIPVDNVEIEFFIVKRKVPEVSEYPIKRVQVFTPPSGKIKLAKATKAVNEFIEEVFNNDGSYKNKTYSQSPSSHNCRFCPFRDKKNLCDRG